MSVCVIFRKQGRQCSQSVVNKGEMARIRTEGKVCRGEGTAHAGP